MTDRPPWTVAELDQMIESTRQMDRLGTCQANRDVIAYLERQRDAAAHHETPTPPTSRQALEEGIDRIRKPFGTTPSRDDVFERIAALGDTEQHEPDADIRAIVDNIER